jgi:hypothetical protein
MTSKPFWSKAGEAPTFPSPMIGEYSTGDGAGKQEVLAIDNAARVGPASDVAPRKTAFHRGAMGAAESLGARLSVSPSDKIPQNEPSSTLANSTRIVKSRGGRSSSTFSAGMTD